MAILMNRKDAETIEQFAIGYLAGCGIKRVVITDDAPSTYEEVLDMVYSRDTTVRVARDGIQGSIYGAIQRHAVIRAWHDVVHALNHWDFSLASEMRVIEFMVNQIKGLDIKPESIRDLWIDLAGQVLTYHITGGKFVTDQQAFLHDFQTLLEKHHG